MHACIRCCQLSNLKQLHESEMVVKLAAALNMSRQELEKELRNSTLGNWQASYAVLKYTTRRIILASP